MWNTAYRYHQNHQDHQSIDNVNNNLINITVTIILSPIRSITILTAFYSRVHIAPHAYNVMHLYISYL